MALKSMSDDFGMGYSIFYCEEQVVVQRIEPLSMEYLTATEYRSGRGEYLPLGSRNPRQVSLKRGCGLNSHWKYEPSSRKEKWFGFPIMRLARERAE